MNRINVVSVKMVKEKGMLVESNIMNNPKKMYSLGKQLLDGADREKLYLLVMDTKLKINAVELVSMGGLTSSTVDMKILFKTALLANGASIAVIHNHPSGVSKPSKNDVEITKRIMQGCEILGLMFIDHLVIGDNEYTSFREESLI